jgi:hypothetical protein
MGKIELWWGSGRQEVKIRLAILFTNDFGSVTQDLKISEVDLEHLFVNQKSMLAFSLVLLRRNLLSNPKNPRCFDLRNSFRDFDHCSVSDWEEDFSF